MDRLRSIAAIAAAQHGAISVGQLERHDIGIHRRRSWQTRGIIERAGARSFVVAGSPPTWWRDLWCAQFDLDGRGVVAGRAAARLHGLDGFSSDQVELLVERSHRGLRSAYDLRSTRLPIGLGDLVTIKGIRCLGVQRTILDGPIFDFTRGEVERAIDSALRLRLASEQRLRTAVLRQHRVGVNGSRILLDALVDTGGESRLERWFLALVRRAGLPRPELQCVVRDGTRTVARVDARFPGGLVVEIEGHATHSSRRQRQADEARRTALMRRGVTVIVFTYLDVRERPAWVAEQIGALLRLAAA